MSRLEITKGILQLDVEKIIFDFTRDVGGLVSIYFFTRTNEKARMLTFNSYGLRSCDRTVSLIRDTESGLTSIEVQFDDRAWEKITSLF